MSVTTNAGGLILSEEERLILHEIYGFLLVTEGVSAREYAWKLSLMLHQPRKRGEVLGEVPCERCGWIHGGPDTECPPIPRRE